MKTFTSALLRALTPSGAAGSPRAPDAGVRAEIGDIGAIEGLRGVAIAWVVLFHYSVARGGATADPWNAWVASHPLLDAVVRHGYLGVDLFFVITGFLLVMPWERRRRLGLAAPDTRAFYMRRIRRIVPAYYVQLLVVFLVFLPLLHALGAPPIGVKHILATLVAHAAFLHYMTPVTSAALGVNGALWTLALEAQYYLLLPLFAAAFVRAPLRWAAGFAAIAVAWHAAARHGLGPLVALEVRLSAPWHVPEQSVRDLLATQLPGYLAHFALGILLALAYLSARERLLFAPARGALGAACRVVEGALGNRPLRALGRVSYSAYLYHLPVICLWREGRILEGHAASMPACMGTILLIAAVSYRFVERPFMRPRAQETSLAAVATA